MNVRELLEAVRDGNISPEDAAVRLRAAPFIDLGYAKADSHRAIRQGSTEVVYGESKDAKQCVGIASALMESGAECVLITRCSKEKAADIVGKFTRARYFEDARIAVIGKPQEPSPNSLVCVVTAGTSDIPVAEEAAVTAESLGSRVERVYDVGVSGLHRLLSKTDVLLRARAVVVVAGMEGALPSVVGGLVDVPVIAVPTSVGYGASFEGLTALLSMMNSCSSDVSVVNIDNGFGAGYIAGMIDRRTAPL
ncbi:NCAIR mutase (PurE)-related protein [Thermoplasmatales archaeon BRNA1]|nr:NCAIR mutase (PurE)-related protein [Thermoplasmatales archaeon BRNA1]